MLEDKINQDLKSAMLAGDASLVSTLRGLKSVILYAKIANGERDKAMSDSVLIPLLQKEAKKRQESADLYMQGGNETKAESELSEKAVIEGYLPKQLSESEVASLVDETILEAGGLQAAKMGEVIAGVKQRAGGTADGAVIARIVKERLTQ